MTLKYIINTIFKLKIVRDDINIDEVDMKKNKVIKKIEKNEKNY